MGAKKGVQLALLQAAYFDLGGGLSKGSGIWALTPANRAQGAFRPQGTILPFPVPDNFLSLPSVGDPREEWVPAKRIATIALLGCSERGACLRVLGLVAAEACKSTRAVLLRQS